MGTGRVGVVYKMSFHGRAQPSLICSSLAVVSAGVGTQAAFQSGSPDFRG